MKTIEQFTERLEKALRGEDSGIVIYWDDQDPQNVGPAYRDERETINGSGSLEFVGWSNVNEMPVNDADVAGYEVGHYFSQNNAYSGPDCHGIYPELES